MPDMNCKMDVSSVIEHFSASGDIRQANFGVVVALNAMANRIQQRVRERLEASFNIRRKQWVLRSVKIEKASRATKQSWRVTVSITMPELAAMESGEAHLPTSGRAALAATAGALTGKIIRGTDPRAIGNLGFGRGTIVAGMKGDKVNSDGTSAAFAVKSRAGNTVILQRSGKGKGLTKVLYRMTSRIRRPAKLRFYTTAQQTIARDSQEIFASAIAQVLRTARR